MKIKSQNERLGQKTSFVRVLYLTEVTKCDYVQQSRRTSSMETIEKSRHVSLNPKNLMSQLEKPWQQFDKKQAEYSQFHQRLKGNLANASDIKSKLQSINLRFLLCSYSINQNLGEKYFYLINFKI